MGMQLPAKSLEENPDAGQAIRNDDTLRREIGRVVRAFADGGLLFCTSHFVQEHCTIEKLTFAYDLVYDLVRNPGKAKS